MGQLFEGIAQTPEQTSKGPCELPILYRDGAQFGLFYLCAIDRAKELLSGTDLEPWPILGKALVTVQVWQYRDSTVGVYNELGVGIQTRRRGSRPGLLRLARDMRAQPDQGIWVVNLPVTTEAAFAAGIEIWGYPKYVTPIDLDFSAEGARARLGDELEVSLPRLTSLPVRSLPVVTFTRKGGDLVRTVIETDYKMSWSTGRSARVRVIGDGPTARSIQALGLERARPLAAFRTDDFKAVLSRGEVQR